MTLNHSNDSIDENKINIFDKFYLCIYEQNNIEITKSISSYLITQQSNNMNIQISNSFHFILIHYIIPYLCPNDLINFKLCNKLVSSLINKKAIDQCIISYSTKNFPSNEIRYNIWSNYLGIEKYKNEKFKEINFKDKKNKDEEYYKELLKKVNLIKEKDELTIKEYTEDKLKLIYNSFNIIKKDIDRTSQLDYFKNGNGKIELKNILESMSIIKENVGYCQGMSFIVGAFVYLLRNEIKSFYAFNSLLNSYELKTLFVYNTPDYNIRVYQLNYYVKKYFPHIYYYFKNNDIPFDLLYSKWIMTILSNYLNMKNLDFAWTCFFINKWKGFIKVCLILIYDLSNELIKCDLLGISNLIKDNNKYHNNLKRSYELYSRKFKVKNSELRQLRDEYYISLAREKIENIKNNVDKWDIDQKECLNNYLKEKEKINLTNKKDSENYKMNMEKLNKKYLASFKNYTRYLDGINKLKKKIDVLATQKLSWETIFSIYEKEAKNLSNKSNYKEFKTIIEEQKEKKSKKNIIEKEMSKIVVKYIPLVNEYDKYCNLLYNKINNIDKYKIQIEQYKNEIEKRKELMNNYFFEYEKKEEELLKILVEKLKLSNNFIKYNKF